jgi:phage baseplate assembly protein W
MAKSTYFGFNPPFYRDGRVMPVQTDERLIKNDLLQLLLTSPGERVFRPDFGTELRRSMFEPIDDFQVGNIKNSIARSIDQFEPRVRVSEIFIERDDENNQLNIKVYAALTIDPNRVLELNLSLPIGPNASQAAPKRLTV